MSGWKIYDMPFPGATEIQVEYWRVGSGHPEPGSMIGRDVRWIDAEGNMIADRVMRVDGKEPITEGQYDLLMAQWEQD